MTTKELKIHILEQMTELLELPESAYEKAKNRYEDIGEWLGRDESSCAGNDPHIFPQGSFRLGTAIQPLDDKEEYDLDLACNLRHGIAKESHTQQSLKNLVGHEIESYRVARGIEAPKEEKHRCWRLDYQDDLSFHMDIVPCIPADDSKRKMILETMINAGESEFIAGSASQLTVSITDDRHDRYRQICDNWNISNPEGYAKWFEARMSSGQKFFVEKAQVDDVPLFKRKTPLQRSIQLLKRHRDQLFKSNDDVKPISIIITTLAARAYQGETDIGSALNSILSKMGSYVYPRTPRIPNPVDPEEDFADRWSMEEYSHLNLEQNFWNWLKQAQSDFNILGSSDDIDFIANQVIQKFAVNFDKGKLAKSIGVVSAPNVIAPKEHNIKEAAKPWCREG